MTSFPSEFLSAYQPQSPAGLTAAQLSTTSLPCSAFRPSSELSFARLDEPTDQSEVLFSGLPGGSVRYSDCSGETLYVRCASIRPLPKLLRQRQPYMKVTMRMRMAKLAGLSARLMWQILRFRGRGEVRRWGAAEGV